MVWASELPGLLEPFEHMAAQGVNVLSSDLPWFNERLRSVLATRSPAFVKAAAGGAMHSHAWAAATLFFLSNIVERRPESIPRQIVPCSADFSDSDDVADSIAHAEVADFTDEDMP